jgi:alanine dehydrogenase
MLVGVPRELKSHEYRVAITPAGVRELTGRGHQVVLEHDAGAGAGLPDEDFVAAGARISADADEVWGAAGLVLKVKEPVPEEYHRLRADQVLFTYLHLAASAECTEALVAAGITAVAYETVRWPDGSLPLLAPMSEVAGRMAPQVGAHHLQRTAGGRGVLLGGVSGVPAGKVAVIGAGVSGMNAAAIALGLQAEVMVLDTDINRLRQIDFAYRGHLQTITSNAYEVERACLWADLVIGAVLVPGAKAPTLVSNDVVSRMRPGSVLVDISIDQGGCFADSRPTTHDDPVFGVHDSIFYCVANMPGAVPNTSTRALTNVTLPYVMALAEQGVAAAVADPALAAGVNVAAGQVVQAEVAAAHGLSAVALGDVLEDLPAPR